ncbi:MAG: hypothetical protein IPK13_10900 [Deltaproteobacteria bacterium]|nr:hypothetical protein [Deltaproteobacteria bacterium]
MLTAVAAGSAHAVVIARAPEEAPPPPITPHLVAATPTTDYFDCKPLAPGLECLPNGEYTVSRPDVWVPTKRPPGRSCGLRYPGANPSEAPPEVQAHVLERGARLSPQVAKTIVSNMEADQPDFERRAVQIAGAIARGQTVELAANEIVIHPDGRIERGGNGNQLAKPTLTTSGGKIAGTQYTVCFDPVLRPASPVYARIYHDKSTSNDAHDDRVVAKMYPCDNLIALPEIGVPDGPVVYPADSSSSFALVSLGLVLLGVGMNRRRRSAPTGAKR